jgi:large subunit ribosomal protein L1
MAEKKAVKNEVENAEKITASKKQDTNSKETKGDKVKKTTKKSDAGAEKKPKKAKSTEKKTTKEPGKSVKKSQLDKRANKYKDAFSKIEKDKEYSAEEAANLIKKISTTKFDGSVEIHINLNIDTKNPDQQIRGSVSLPAGLGKDKKVAVVCKEDKEKEAKDAGAEIVGGSELIEKIGQGKVEFDVLVATPNMMGELAKIGRILGPKGLMPNPKDNTVTDNLKSTITDIKKGRAEYRADSYGIVHSVVGKVSFDEKKLLENIQAFLKEIHNIKPASIKSNYIKSIYLTTTMGPSIKIKE